jgi:uncharacterized protein YlxP (DUF503 family)
VEAVYKRKTYSYRFTDMPISMPADWGLGDNRCQPKRKGKDDRGFALLNRDPWFLTNPVATALTADYKMKMADVAKRDLFQRNDIPVLGVNASSHSTETEGLMSNEPLEQFRLIKCTEKSCRKEMEEMDLESVRITYIDQPTRPAGIAATGTTASSHPRVISGGQGQDLSTASSRSSLVTAFLPRMILS